MMGTDHNSYSVLLIDLSNSGKSYTWDLGQVLQIAPDPKSLKALCDNELMGTKADAVLFWDFSSGNPSVETVSQLLSRKSVDIWHAGLSLGLSKKPPLLDYAMPNWPLNCDADPSFESSSWRLSLQACLIHTTVFKEVGGFSSEFDSWVASGLEFGYRCMRQGVIIRHTSVLIARSHYASDPQLSVEDELRFVYNSHGKKWACWALLRAVLCRYVSPISSLMAASKVLSRPKTEVSAVYNRNQVHLDTISFSSEGSSVTVLIATLDRYEYLRRLLSQLRDQSIEPVEILVIDQTERTHRENLLQNEFMELPLQIIQIDEPGQVLSRNIGLQMSKGDFVLFVDDDDEIPANLIEMHLKNLHYFDADVSAGSVDEIGALPLTDMFTRVRVSDIFPTNNSMVRRKILLKSGLFDMAFQRRQSEDGDLGMRMYLSGALMIYNPQIKVIHHRAPRGGLRVHGARVITYSSSRQRLFHRRFPHISEVYILLRYFSSRQITESFWVSIVGTFSIRGSIRRKILKIVIAMLLFPHSYCRLRRIHRAATELLHDFPQIPELEK